MVVNIGGFIGPFVASLLYKDSWDIVFYMSIAAMAINLIITLFFYREPAVTDNGQGFLKNIGIAFRNIGVTLTDWRFLLFLLIIGVFWTAYNQLYYSFPVFLESWVNLDGMSASLGLDAGTITTVTISSLASFFIILFQLIVSSVTARVKTAEQHNDRDFYPCFRSGDDVCQSQSVDNSAWCTDLRDR